ncbi:hypothetical protein Tco_0184322 [Tanacetum coccineum]
MVALIAERRRKFEAQSSAIYSTGWTLKYVKRFTDDQLKSEFDKIRNAAADLQAQNLKRSLKRLGADVEQPGSKKSKSSVAPQTSTPAVTPDTSVDPPVAPTPSFATSVSRSSGPRTRSQLSPAGIQTYSTRRKSLATRKMSSSEVDLNAPDESFIQVLSDDDSDDTDDDTNPLLWHAFAAWEVVPTGLGDVNALYFTDKSSKYFTHLREILHLLDRQDLSKLYGMVVKHYDVNPLAGTGMILWGDLHVLFESTTGGSSVEVWNDQQEWVIHSWKLFPFSGVHVLETFTGKILYMFADTPYPLSASLMQKMLKHKLEVEIDGIGNDMTYAVQLIKFIKNQLASSAFRWFLRFLKFLDGIPMFCSATALKSFLAQNLFSLASPEQTATGKDKSNPFLAVMTCQKSYSSSTYYDSCSESGKWFQSSMDLTLSGYVVPTGRVIATVSIKVPTGRLEDLSRGSCASLFLMKSLGERGIECIFVGYAEHSNAFRFYVIEPNESVSINSIIEPRDVIFDENRFSSVPRPIQRSLINETKDIGDLVDMKDADVILVSTLWIQVEADDHNGLVMSVIEYSRVIGFLMYAMTYTRSDIAFGSFKLLALQLPLIIFTLSGNYTTNINVTPMDSQLGRGKRAQEIVPAVTRGSLDTMFNAVVLDVPNSQEPIQIVC